MKLFHLCILTSLTFLLIFTNPSSISALQQPDLAEIPAHFTVRSEPDNKDFIQIFDIKSGKIIKTVPNDAEIQKFTNELISSITGLAPEIAPDNEAKYIIRIPITTPRQIKVGQTNLLINELFLFYYTTDHSILLVFDENKKPFLLHYDSDITPLIKYVTSQ